MEPVTSKIGFISLLIISNACLLSCKKPQTESQVKESGSKSDYEQPGYSMKEIGCVINSFNGDQDSLSRDLISQVLAKSNKFASLKVDNSVSRERNSYDLGFGSTVSFRAADQSGQQYKGWIDVIPNNSGNGTGAEIPSHDGAPTMKSKWTLFQLSDSSGQDVLHVDDWGGFSVQKSCFLLYELASESESKSES